MRTGIAIGVLILLGVAIWFMIPFPNIAGDGGYKMQGSRVSPDGKMIAELWDYQAGATARGFSFVAIRQENHPSNPDNKENRVCLVDGNRSLQMEWDDAETLKITGNLSGAVFAHAELGGIKIEYDSGE